MVREFDLSGGVYNSQVHPTLRIRDDGFITIPQSHGQLTLWYEDTKMLVLKEKGHKEYYNQYNPPFTIPTQFHVFMKPQKSMPTGVKETLMEVGVFPLNQQKEDA